MHAAKELGTVWDVLHAQMTLHTFWIIVDLVFSAGISSLCIVYTAH